MIRNHDYLCALVTLMLLSLSCRKEKEELKSSEKEILSYVFKAANNPSLSTDLFTTIRNDTIFWSFTSEAISRELVPTIEISAGATIESPITTEAVDLSQRVTYTVKAADGSLKTYVTSLQLVSAPVLSGFKINGRSLSYDSASSTFYFPMSVGTTLSTLTVQFDTTLAEKLLVDATLAPNNRAVDINVAMNQVFTIKPATAAGLTGEAYHLVVTGMPIVQLTTLNTINGDDYVRAAMTLTDPDSAAHGSTGFISSDILIKWRGNTARDFPKKAYGLKLQDASGNDQDIPLLGLREDQSWILDAMYIDQARMRNRLCTDIWNSYNNVPYLADEPQALNGTRGYFVEVFMNNEYIGLYCMTEKMDRKQLKVKKKGGFVYKGNDWTTATLFTGVGEAFDNSSDTWNGWESDYPDADDDVAMNWSYLYDLVGFVATSADADFIANAGTHLNLPNMADFLIQLNLIGGEDNLGKNAFLSVYNVSKGVQFFYTPWDMDNTFGRSYTGALFDNTTVFYGPEANNIFTRLLALNPASFRETVKARWNTLKTAQLSKATINARIEAYKDLLTNTKAIEREATRWGTLDLATETSWMETWYSSRFDYLDTYFNSL